MPRSYGPTIEIVYRYVGQNPEIWYVFCDNIEELPSSSSSIMESNFAATSYGNGFTPINPRGTFVTWQGLHGTIRDYQQQLTSALPPQSQNDRNDNSPFLNPIPLQAPQLAQSFSRPLQAHPTQIPSWIARSPFESQMTNTSGTFPQPRHDRSGDFLVPMRPPQAPLAQIHSRAAPTHSESQLTNISGTILQPRHDRSGNLLVPLRTPQAPLAQIHSRAAPTHSESQLTNMSGTFAQPRRDRSDNLLVPLRTTQAPFAQIHSRAAPTPEGQVTNMSGTLAQPRRDRSGNLLFPLRPLQARPTQNPRHAAPTPSESQVTNMSATFPQPRRDRSGNLLSQAPLAQSPSYTTPLPSRNRVTDMAGASPQPRSDGGDNSLVTQRRAQAPLTGILSFTTPSPSRKRMADIAAASLRDRSGNSLVTQPPPQFPLTPILSFTTPSPSRKRRTDTSRRSSGNLVESDWPGTPSRAYTDESHICSTDRTPLGPPADSSRSPKQITRARSRPNSTPVPQPNALYQTPPSKSIGPSSSKLSPPSTTTTPTRKRAPALPPTCQNCKGVGHNKRNCPVLWCSYCNTNLHQYGECPLAKAASIVEADTKAALSLKRAIKKRDQEEAEWTPQKGKKRAKKN